MTTPNSEAITWSRGFFRFWVFLSAVWIIGAVWIAIYPPAQNGPPPFDETLPFLKPAPDGKFFTNLAECEASAKRDPRVDLQNCAQYFEAERWQPIRRFVKSAALAIIPPLVLLFFGAAVGWVLRGFRRGVERAIR